MPLTTNQKTFPEVHETTTKMDENVQKKKQILFKISSLRLIYFF